MRQNFIYEATLNTQQSENKAISINVEQDISAGFRSGKEAVSKYKNESWLRFAAEQGDAASQYELGRKYGAGKCNAERYIEAINWYRLAADQGYLNAMFKLGLIYENGKCVPYDFVEAVKWYRLAAEQGSVFAQYNLAGMLYKGLGVSQDYIEAAKWYRLAAEQGDFMAQYNYGVMYAKGVGVTKNLITAFMWWTCSAISGDAEAIKARNSFARKLNSIQIEAAEKSAAICIANNFKGCETN
jgi:TPR repeat protein